MLGSVLLVVDDDPALRRLIVRILQGWGYASIGEAGTVADALSAAEGLRPDIALVDISLPDGNGFVLTEELVARFSGLRVVIFSSDTDRANVAAATRAGAIGFLPKDEMSGVALRELIGDGDEHN